MDEIDKAIENLVKAIRTNIKPEDATKFTQAALNLAQAKQVLFVTNNAGTKSKGAGS